MRLTAALSLVVIVASQSSASVIPRGPTCSRVTGEYSRTSASVIGMRRDSWSSPRSARAST